MVYYCFRISYLFFEYLLVKLLKWYILILPFSLTFNIFFNVKIRNAYTKQICLNQWQKNLKQGYLEQIYELLVSPVGDQIIKT